MEAIIGERVIYAIDTKRGDGSTVDVVTTHDHNTSTYTYLLYLEYTFEGFFYKSRTADERNGVTHI